MAPDGPPTVGLLGAAYNVLTAQIFGAIAPHAPGLRPAHGNVMEHLDRTDGLRLTDIAAAAGLTPQSVGELVDQLVELGYVERRPDPDDRRAKRIWLTTRARGLRTVSARAVADAEARIVDAIGERGYANLRRQLMMIVGPGA